MCNACARVPSRVLKRRAYWAGFFSAAVDNAALINALLQGPRSGVSLAAEFGVSRAAVWKRIDQLRERGLAIDANNRAYQLRHGTALLDGNAILAAMPKDGAASISGLQVDFEMESTQLLALRHAAPEQGIAVWLAECQTGGQGRRGKRWLSPPLANIYASLNRRFQCAMADMSGFSLACAVMLAQSLQARGVEGVQLKWPNDIWLDGEKCAGLLIQMRGEAAGPCELTVGFGVNVHLQAEQALGIDQPWTAIAKHQPGLWDRNVLLAGILTDLQHGFTRFEQGGFAAFQADWKALDGLFGKVVRLDLGVQQIEGIADGVEADGALRFQGQNGLQRFHSGELSVKLNHG
jgi:BirA family transcriptional regulator, biotin operon repressor / biotin---[acetyl-CoA-carboxylase] ligase